MEGIHSLRVEELKESSALSNFAFQNNELAAQVMDIEKQFVKPEQIWGYFVQGNLAARMTIFPLRTFIQGKPFLMGGIALVATWPEHRRGGMVGKLICHTLQVMKASGQTVAFLNPFSFPFYRKYGWETSIDRKCYTIESAQLPSIESPGGRIERVDNDWKLLNGIYEDYAETYNGMLCRDEKWWMISVLKQNKGQTAVYYDNLDKPRGYLLYNVKNRQMNVQEFVYLDEAARRGLWKFIANHDSMIDRVTLMAPVDDPLPFLLQDPRIKQEITPYFMTRIVDFADFVAQYTFTVSDESERILHFQITDLHAPWNEGLFQLKVDAEGKAEIIRVTSNVAPFLSCDIQTITCILMCYQTPSLLHQIGRLKGNSESVDLLQSLLPRRSTYLMDAF
jgi:predicted acetyltransferase